MKGKPVEAQYAVCVCNDGYPASLELQKVYRVLLDEPARRAGQVRVIDESGEDYLYPASWFVETTHPTAAQLRRAS